MNLQESLSLETVHADGTESEAREESEASEESDASKALVATSCPAVLSGFPCLKYHAAFDISSRHGIPQGPECNPAEGGGCRSMQTHRLSCSPLASIRVACMKNSERVQQKLNASITRQLCASPSAHTLLDFDHHKASKIET